MLCFVSEPKLKVALSFPIKQFMNTYFKELAYIYSDKCF